MAHPQTPITPGHDDVPTLWDSFLRGYSLAGGSSNCIGTRLTWDNSSPQAAQPLPEYKWLSYARVLARVRDLSAGFIDLFGLSCLVPPGSSDHPEKGDGLDRPRIALWCPSSPCWTISEYAAYRNSITVVSMDDQLSAQAATEVIRTTRPRAVILSTQNFNRLTGYRDHQRRHQITSSRIDSSDIDSNNPGNSLGSALSSPSTKGTPKKTQTTTTHEGPGVHVLGAESPSAGPRDPSHSARDSIGTPSVCSSSTRHPGRSEPIYIITDPLEISSNTRLNALRLGLTFYSLEEVYRIGHTTIINSLPIHALDYTLEPQKVVEIENLNPLRPRSSTLACIVYSSGTTGTPKPCVLSHANFAANLAAFNLLVQQEKLRDLHTQDLVQFSYLPLHHIYEKQTQAWVLNQGGSIGFSSLENPRLLEDLSLLKPTFLNTTPNFLTHQILDRRLQFLNNFHSFKNPIESYLLNKAIDQKLLMLKMGFGEQIWLWDRFVLGYLRDQLGGRLKWIVSGTSPLSKHVAELLSASLSVKISEGYGLTETCGAACMTVEDDSLLFSVGHVGPPLPCCEIKLKKVDGLAAIDEESGLAQGEVYVRGANVFRGYLVPSSSTSEERIESAVDGEGWFATGDIGHFDASGRLHLVDRLLTLDGRTEVIHQEVHNRFNLIDLGKIERKLNQSIQEISQIFVSGRTADTHAEVGIGMIGDLVGFVVVNRPCFLRWYTINNPSNNQLVSRHPQNGPFDDDPTSIDATRGDDEWEIVNENPDLDPPLQTEGDSSAPSSASPTDHLLLLTSDSDYQFELDKICKTPVVIKSFLNYLGRRSKSIGLKSHEIPKMIYLSTREFKPRDDDTEDEDKTKKDEKGKSTEIEHQQQDEILLPSDHSTQSSTNDTIFLSLNSKNSRLMNHFS
ncbi:hypothetical protein PSTG_04749 [Puccinia striiformis f. sp. tritici PST-78]|uniref:AMP-dependent synthetase/ligase domain-containing protein n=1 Tax=Puccinia striiformis f. sp. tritici PST-78 TaxID=1165861 RepID=A0A0L0VRN4_9BASI|nr:hypothetical protein PSTG_04749 [Puccinia striiformis f. sp. tritici PST-78]